MANKTLSKIKNAVTRAGAVVAATMNEGDSRLYDFSTPETREAAALVLYGYAKTQREPWVQKWRKYDNYYNGNHDTVLQIAKSCADNNIQFPIACVQDPFIHVESQIIPDVPDFEFNGRDDDLDSYKAKQREYVVKFILELNKIENMNTDNERRLCKLGNAIWKVYWDNNIPSPDGKKGNIRIIDVDPANLFPDPAAYDLYDCEYLFYPYRMHKRKAAREFSADLKAKDMTIDDFGLDGNYNDTMIYDSRIRSESDDTVSIMEFWYLDDDGDPNCSILINGKEIKNTGKYWAETHEQNKSFPFVKYCKISDENNFWDKSELANILDLTDAADREMAYGLLNAAYSSNDMLIVEEGALADGQTLNNAPGGRTNVKQNKINSIKRLGGMNPIATRENSITFIQSQIEKTIGNFDTSMGVEPARVTTASGIAQLNERADSRKDIKKCDRITGFERLLELVDWSVLEFYDEDRLIYLKAPDGGLYQSLLTAYNQTMQQYQQTTQQGQPLPKPPTKPKILSLFAENGQIMFSFNSSKFINKKGDLNYFPRVNAKVYASDSLTKSKAFTVQMLQQIIGMPITVENYKLVEAWVDLLNLPTRKEIKDYIENFFKNAPIGIPKTTLNFKDLPPDGKVELAQKIGLNIQTPVPADAQNVPYDLLKGGAPTSGIVTDPVNVTQPQGQQVDPQIAQQLNDILSNAHVHLTPEELQHLQQHPEILEEMLKGGQQNV